MAGARAAGQAQKWAEAKDRTMQWADGSPWAARWVAKTGRAPAMVLSMAPPSAEELEEAWDTETVDSLAGLWGRAWEQQSVLRTASATVETMAVERERERPKGAELE